MTANPTNENETVVTLCFTTIADNQYVVEFTDSLSSGTWSEWPNTAIIGDSMENCVELVSSNTMQFYRVKLVSGIVRTIEAEDADDSSGISVHSTYIGSLDPGDWACYDDIDLAGIETIEFSVASTNSGTRIQLRMDSPSGPIIAELTVTVTGGLQTYTLQTTALTDVSGVHRLCLTALDTNTVNIDKLILRVEGPTVTLPGAYGAGAYASGLYGH